MRLGLRRGVSAHGCSRNQIEIGWEVTGWMSWRTYLRIARITVFVNFMFDDGRPSISAVSTTSRGFNSVLEMADLLLGI